MSKINCLIYSFIIVLLFTALFLTIAVDNEENKDKRGNLLCGLRITIALITISFTASMCYFRKEMKKAVDMLDNEGIDFYNVTPKVSFS